jgi:hypothetical protein
MKTIFAGLWIFVAAALFIGACCFITALIDAGSRAETLKREEHARRRAQSEASWFAIWGFQLGAKRMSFEQHQSTIKLIQRCRENGVSDEVICKYVELVGTEKR